jgi:hypothetical protein
MEQLPPLVYRRAGPHRNRTALDMDPSREGIHPTHRDKAAMNGAPAIALKPASAIPLYYPPSVG